MRLRLVKVKIGKTTMWMLTSVLDRKKLPNKKLIKYCKMRWGVEVEYRGLKQTTDKRSLAHTMRALRKCMRNLQKNADPSSDLLIQLSGALVEKYHNHTDKKARYRPKNPDKKPLGEPKVRKLNSKEQGKLRKLNEQIAA